MKKSTLLGLLLLVIFSNSCQKLTGIEAPNPSLSESKFEAAIKINKNLGKGINLSAFDGNFYNKLNTNPVDLKNYIDEIKRLGFKHIRLPVRWDRTDRILTGPPYTITPDFIKEIKNIVDYALSRELYVILNIHNYTALYENPLQEKERFLSQWKQLATEFNDYPGNLLFEILNEPHGNLTPSIWNEYYKEALSIIRSTPINSNNANRTVLIGTADSGGVRSLRQLELPQNDEHLILTIHYYTPFRFTHQNSWIVGSADWKGTTWDDTECERNALINDFSYAAKLAKEKKTPINIGEFGSYSEADIKSITRYAKFLSTFFNQQEFSYTYWNFLGDFGVYNEKTKTYNQPLLESLSSDSSFLVAHVPAHSQEIYTSNITSINKEGWEPANNESGVALMNITYGPNSIDMNITNSGSNQYALLIQKKDIKIEKGKKYCITFTGSSTVTDQSIQATFTETNKTDISPAISSEAGFYFFDPIPRKYSFVFTALSSQTDGRMKFYVGGHTTSSVVNISDINISEFYD